MNGGTGTYVDEGSIGTDQKIGEGFRLQDSLKKLHISGLSLTHLKRLKSVVQDTFATEVA